VWVPADESSRWQVQLTAQEVVPPSGCPWAHRHHGCSKFARTQGAKDKLTAKSFAEDCRMLQMYLVAGPHVLAMFLYSPLRVHQLTVTAGDKAPP